VRAAPSVVRASVSGSRRRRSTARAARRRSG
jgi:hypothetical protein